MYKPDIDAADVTSFLEKWAAGSVKNVTHIDAGFVSTIFSFEHELPARTSTEKLVAKFSSPENEGGLEKNQFVASLVPGGAFPVAEHLEVGSTELPVRNLTAQDAKDYSGDSFPLTYSIIRWIEGESFPDLQSPESSSWIAVAIDSIEQISSVDISKTEGWGWFDSKGIGAYKSWREHLLASCFDKTKSRLYAQHPERFRSGFLELETFEHFSMRLSELTESLPELPRRLVHTDFGWDNVLVDGKGVVAIIDWDNAVFGDEMYDLARLDVYAPRIDLRTMVESRWKDEGRNTQHFEVRWKVCALHMILDTLGWYGWSNKPDAYRWMKARGLELLGEGPEVRTPHPNS